MKYRLYKIFAITAFIFLISLSQAYAVEVNKPEPKQYATLSNPIKANNVQEAIILAVDLAIFLGTILAVLAFIWVGFKFVLAQGNDTKLKEAKDWFMYAAIGTAILISSKVIVEVIKSTLISTGIVNKTLF